MNVSSTKYIITILVASVLAGSGWYIYRGVLPYYYSGQKLDLVDGSGQYDYSNEQGVFHGRSVRSIPVDEVESRQVLGTSDPTVKKTIEVDLTAQKLYALENGVKVAEFMVSTGKWGRTPTGTYKIWTKIRSQKMSGGSKALGTYYYLPNVPYIMFFYNESTPQSMGYSIHGAYWHANFGVPMSHGCVNMRIRDVEKLYYWAQPQLSEGASIRATEDNPGTEITIYGKSVDG